MNEKILLTVAIPTYNRVKFLGRAMDSVLSQMTDEIELLISDNASQDGTEALVEKKMREYPSIRYLRNPENIGPDANFLQCMKEAKGEYILLLGDDDLIVENAVEKMIAFLKNEEECALIFLNYCSFRNVYRGLAYCTDSFLKRKDGYLVTQDKNLFLRTCSHMLTYMSSFLVSRKAFLTVESPEKYNDTSFMHTCIALEASRAEGAKFGTIFSTCIAQDGTIGNAGIDHNLSSFFLVFGERMYRLYCEIAPQFGFDLKTAREAYSESLGTWRRIILKLKSVSDKKWRSEYQLHGKPILKKFKGAYIKCLPILIMPNWAAKIVHTVFKPIYRKIKHLDQ